MNTWYDQHEEFRREHTGINKSDLRRNQIGKSLLLIVLISSLLNIAKWLFGVSAFDFLQPAGNSMRNNTAICFVLSSSVLLLLQTSIKSRHIFTLITGLLISLAGLINFTTYIFALINPGENPLDSFPTVGGFLSSENRMAFITAVLFIITGIMLAFLSSNTASSLNIAHALALPVIFISYFVPVSYILGSSSLFAINQTEVSFYSGLNFCLIGVSVLLTYPHTWVMRVFVDQFTGGNMARNLIPGIIIAPLIIGWLRINGEKAGFFKSETGVIMVVVTYTVCFLILVWLSAKSVIRVDEKKRMLDASLRQSREQYYILVESANSIIMRYDNKGTIRFVNAYGLRFFGYTREEIIGENLSMIIPDEDSTGRKLSALVDDILTSPRDYVQVENECIKKTGERVWINWTNRAFINNKGEISEILSIGNDFTERRRMEKEVSDKAHFITNITETVPDLISIIDLRTRNLLYANKAPFLQQGFDAEGISKMSSEERNQLIHPEDRRLLENYFEMLSARTDESIESVEYRAKTIRGDWMWFRARGKVFERNPDGTPKSCINIVQNDTERKLVLESLRDSEEKFR